MTHDSKLANPAESSLRPDYYVMRSIEMSSRVVQVGHDRSSDMAWRSGRFIGEPPKSVLLLALRRHPQFEKYPISAFFESDVPLMNRALLNLLLEEGVDNIEEYRVDVEIGSQRLAGSYSAVNVIGALAFGDAGRNVFRSHSDMHHHHALVQCMDMVVDRVALEFAPKIFRLGEAGRHIVVDGCIADRAVRGRVPGLLFFPLLGGEVRCSSSLDQMPSRISYADA